MITEAQIIERVGGLDAADLHAWIDLEMLKPHRDESGYLFDDIDQARVALICDLRYRMELDRESLPVILSLVDQLHHVRHSLRAISTAVSEQSEEVRVAITSRTRVMLSVQRR